MPAPETMVAVLAAVFGAMVGSFLNVCIHRLPLEQSVVQPRSRCPGCGTMIAWYDNIPIVSWLMLRAKCRHCGAPISWQYPLIEAAIALTWGLAVWYYGLGVESVATASFVTILAGILLTDARHMLIPDEFSLGGLGLGLGFAAPGSIRGWALGGAVGAALVLSALHRPLRAAYEARRAAAPEGAEVEPSLAFSFVDGWRTIAIGAAVALTVAWLVARTTGEAPLMALLPAAVGAAVGYGVLWLAGTLGRMWAGRDAMGGGDLKMMAMVGAFTGWRGVFLTVFLGSLIGTIVFLPALLRRERNREIPFGIFLAAGAVVALLFGDALVAWYARTLWPN